MEDFIKKRRKILQKQKKLRLLCLPQLLYDSPLKAFFLLFSEALPRCMVRISGSHKLPQQILFFDIFSHNSSGFDIFSDFNAI